jgi:hypothetical protein
MLLRDRTDEGKTLNKLLVLRNLASLLQAIQPAARARCFRAVGMLLKEFT